MAKIIIIRDEEHPLLEKIEEKIKSSKENCQIITWQESLNFDYSEINIVFMDRMGEKLPTYESQILAMNFLSQRDNFKIINNPLTYIFTRNKILTYYYLKDNGFDIPETYIITDLKDTFMTM